MPLAEAPWAVDEEEPHPIRFDDGERQPQPGGASRKRLEVLNRLVWIPFVLGWLVALAFFLRFGG